MENPATWGPAEHVVADVLANDDANRTRPVGERRFGASRARLICDALRTAGLLADPELCRCGHGPDVHPADEDTPLCEVCGDNTHCNYADDEEIAADRWDEGYLQAVIHLCPAGLTQGERLMWSIDHMPKDNPYQPDAMRSRP